MDEEHRAKLSRYQEFLFEVDGVPVCSEIVNTFLDWSIPVGLVSRKQTTDTVTELDNG